VRDRDGVQVKGRPHDSYRTHMVIGRRRSDPLVDRVQKLICWQNYDLRPIRTGSS
jgi:hypothetical protein